MSRRAPVRDSSRPLSRARRTSDGQEHSPAPQPIELATALLHPCRHPGELPEESGYADQLFCLRGFKASDQGFALGITSRDGVADGVARFEAGRELADV